MPRRASLLPNPEQLELYARLSPELPPLVLKAADNEQEREYRYAVVSLLTGSILGISVIGGFVYLVMQGHAVAAGWLLGVNVLNLIHGFVRNRLRGRETKTKPA